MYIYMSEHIAQERRRRHLKPECFAYRIEFCIIIIIYDYILVYMRNCTDIAIKCGVVAIFAF